MESGKSNIHHMPSAAVPPEEDTAELAATAAVPPAQALAPVSTEYDALAPVLTQYDALAPVLTEDDAPSVSAAPAAPALPPASVAPPMSIRPPSAPPASEAATIAPTPAPTPADDAEPQPIFSPPAIQKLKPLPAASGPEPIPPGPKAFDEYLTRKNLVIAGSAAAGLLILGAYLAIHKAKAQVPVPVPEIVEHLDLTGLSGLPDSFQAGAQAVLAGHFQPPAWLQDLDHGSGGDLEYPVREAIDEVQPTLRWPAFSSSYNVAVISPDHQVVARAEIFGASEWTLPVELPRGAVYTWEVASLGQVRRNRFRVLDEAESASLNTLRSAHGESHLLMGMAALQLGLMSQAQREFSALRQDHPHSPEAAQLLSTVNQR